MKVKLQAVKKWFESKRNRTIFILSTIFIVLFFTFKLPYEVLLPGGINEIEDTVEIEDAYESEGQFHTSYVTVITKPSPFVYLFVTAFKEAEVRRMSESEAKLSVKEINQYSRLSKLYSVNTSLIAAYNAADEEITYNVHGMTLAYRFPDFPIFDNVELGDVITHIDGVMIDEVDDVANYMNTVSDCDQPISLTLIRNEREMTINNRGKQVLIGDEAYCRLGIYGYPNFEEIESNRAYTIKDDEGYGSSGGLMQALMIYNKLIEEDITYGYKIAGTGGIDADGNVTLISGIKQKVMGAIEEDVEIYFAPNLAPDPNYPNRDNLYQIALETKEEMKSDITIIPIVTLEDAINYLKTTYGNKP